MSEPKDSQDLEIELLTDDDLESVSGGSIGTGGGYCNSDGGECTTTGGTCYSNAGSCSTMESGTCIEIEVEE